LTHPCSSGCCASAFFSWGDGYLFVRTIPHIHGAGDVYSFRNEPVPNYIIWKVWQLLRPLNVASWDELAPHLVNIAAGAASLLIVMLLVKYFTEDSLDRTFAYLFIAVSGSSQLFFDYVENYTLLYFGFMLFIWLSLACLKGKTHPLMPSIAFALLFTLQFGMICMLPAFLLLLFRVMRSAGVKTAALSIVVMAATVFLLLMICGYTFKIFADSFFKGSGHPLSLSTVNDSQAYTLFSHDHLIDLANLQLLIALFALIVLMLIALRGRKKIIGSFDWLSLLLAALCGFVFVGAIAPELGMSRDWDLLSTFCLGTVTAGAFAMVRYLTSPVRQSASPLMIGITLLHTAGWIGLNSGDKSYMPRFKTLPEGRFFGKLAMLSAYEELGIYYRTQEDPKHAIEYFSKCLVIDSTKSRIYCSIAHIYNLMGDTENEMRFYEKAVQHGAAFWDIYASLGIIYAARGMIFEALVVTKKGLELNPGSPEACINAGILTIRSGGAYEEALSCFLRDIAADPLYAQAYHNAGMCCFSMKKFEGVKFYLGKYLQLKPDSPESVEIRRLLEKDAGDVR